MNINLKLDIPITGHQTLKIKPDLMLYPYYCLEEDVLNPFEEFKETDRIHVRKIIFENSLKVLSKTKLIESLGLIDEESLFILRRDYTICLSAYELVKKLKTEVVNSLSRAKSLGDFSVRTTTKTTSVVLERIMADSRQCIREFEEIIKDIERTKVVPKSFVKGQLNSTNITPSHRMWWLADMKPYITDSYASSKYTYNSNKYKAGHFNQKSPQNYVPESRIEPDY